MMWIIFRVGLWRSWERASMAWKRSRVRIPSGPPKHPPLKISAGCDFAALRNCNDGPIVAPLVERGDGIPGLGQLQFQLSPREMKLGSSRERVAGLEDG